MGCRATDINNINALKGNDLTIISRHFKPSTLCSLRLHILSYYQLYKNQNTRQNVCSILSSRSFTLRLGNKIGPKITFNASIMSMLLGI